MWICQAVISIWKESRPNIFSNSFVHGCWWLEYVGTGKQGLVTRWYIWVFESIALHKCSDVVRPWWQPWTRTKLLLISTWHPTTWVIKELRLVSLARYDILKKIWEPIDLKWAQSEATLHAWRLSLLMYCKSSLDGLTLIERWWHWMLPFDAFWCTLIYSDYVCFLLQVIAAFLNENSTIRFLNLETCLIKDAGVEARCVLHLSERNGKAWRGG